MKHIKWLCLVLLLGVLIGGSAKAQQPRFTGYDFTVEDNFASVEAATNHIPSNEGVVNVQTNTIEAGEVAHSCRASLAHPGSHSIWFALNFAGGTLSIDLQGSTYDTVMSVYQPAGTFAGLTSVACNDDDIPVTDTTSRISVALPAGIYYVQISRFETAPTGASITLNVSMSAAFGGSAPPNDNFATPQEIRFNETLTTNNIQYATEESAEPDRSCPSAVQPSHSVWYKLTQPANPLGLIYSVTTEGSTLDYGRAISTDTVIDVFYGLSLAGLTEQDCNDDLIGTYGGLVDQVFPNDSDTVYLRVSAYGIGNLIGPSSFKIKVTLQLFGAFNAEPGFETVPLTQWTVSNLTGGDGQLCNVPNTVAEGVCSIRFVGSPTEASSLKQTITLPPQILYRKNHLVLFTFGLRATDPAINLKVVLNITYSDGTPASKLAIKVKDTTPGIALHQQGVPLTSKNVSGMKVTIKHKSTAGTAYLDPVLVQMVGNLARDAVLPLPGAPSSAK